MAVFIHYVPMENFVWMYCSWPVFSLSPWNFQFQFCFPTIKEKRWEGDCGDLSNSELVILGSCPIRACTKQVVEGLGWGCVLTG